MRYWLVSAVVWTVLLSLLVLLPGPAVRLPGTLPRRPAPHSIPSADLVLRSPPQWRSCPGPTAQHSIWSMATNPQIVEYALVLATSVRASWNYSVAPLPDFRLIVPEPEWGGLGGKTVERLERAGWGVCVIPAISFLDTNWNPMYHYTYHKIHVWNQTQYTAALWLDSDTMAVGSLDPLLARYTELAPPGSPQHDMPRLGVSYDRDWWTAVVERGAGRPGGAEDSFNSGVMLIRPDAEEYLWLLNVKLGPPVATKRDIGAEQGWLNALYVSERIDIGFPFNARIGLSELDGGSLWSRYWDQVKLVHFAWKYKPDEFNCPQSLLHFCHVWHKHNLTVHMST